MLEHAIDLTGLCRAYPFADAKFPGSKFYGKFNPQDFVCIIPDAVEDAKDYDPMRHGVEYAKLIILFKVCLLPKRPTNLGYSNYTPQKENTEEVEMAFVHMLDDFAESINPICKLDPEGKQTCLKHAQTCLKQAVACSKHVFAGEEDVLHSNGYHRLYETDVVGKGPWYGVIPVSRILGKAALLPDLEDSDARNSCIPSWAKDQRTTCFPNGQASTKSKPGSRCYYVNPLAMKFGRTGCL